MIDAACLRVLRDPEAGDIETGGGRREIELGGHANLSPAIKNKIVDFMEDTLWSCSTINTMRTM